MFKLNLHLFLLLLHNYFHYGGTVNYNNPYASNQPHLLHATNTNDSEGYRNNAQPGYPAYQRHHVGAQSEQNQRIQGNSNYQQLYRYYYTPPYQHEHQQQQPPYQPTHLWSGPPIVVEDEIQQQYYAATTNIPPIFYQQHPTTSSSGSSLLPSLHRNSKVLTPPVYNPQTTPRSTNRQFNYNNYNNNNNNNIVYHRNFRHQIDAIPESQHSHQKQDIVSWNNQQQLLGQQNRQEQQQQPQQFHATYTNLRYNGISNDLSSSKKDNVPDYREHFKRYLENNPRRIKPLF